MTTMSEKVRYKNPPIVERIIAVYHQIPQDQFEARLPSWVEKIRSDYPVSEPLAQWIIDIESKGGVPFVKSLAPKAGIIHVFWQRHPKGLHVRGMQLRRDRLVLHLRREEKNPHDFDELLPEMERWLPRWAEHFDVPDVGGITLEYVNQLNAEITPQFVERGSLKIGEALTIFGTFPGPVKGITSPYDCKARLVIDELKPTFFDVRVHADDAVPNGVRVDFAVRTTPAGKRLKFADAIAELRIGHDIMLEQFTCFFTDHAKLSFDK
jgi:hypothetical protein